MPGHLANGWRVAGIEPVVRVGQRQIREEKTAAGAVVKRFFDEGVQLVTGQSPGSYYYTLDHLDSTRELIDGSGNIRCRYSYDPFGRRTRVSGDLDADFGFAGMFWTGEAGLNLTLHRAYDPNFGRWLSRDPLPNAEIQEGVNLFAYVSNRPINAADPTGLCCEAERARVIQASDQAEADCNAAKKRASDSCTEYANNFSNATSYQHGDDQPNGGIPFLYCIALFSAVTVYCAAHNYSLTHQAENDLSACESKPCGGCK